MKYPNIAVQFDDFDEIFEVIEQVDGMVYREIAKFKDRVEAFDWAQYKAEKKGLGDVVDLVATEDEEDDE